MAKFDPFLSFDCARVEGVDGALQGKEGNKFSYLTTLTAGRFKQIPVRFRQIALLSESATLQCKFISKKLRKSGHKQKRQATSQREMCTSEYEGIIR